MNERDAQTLAEIILDVWAGGSENANDFVDRDADPEQWVYVTQLAMKHSDLIQELAYNNGVERLIIAHIRRKEAYESQLRDHNQQQE
jgi:hypothetical protein